MIGLRRGGRAGRASTGHAGCQSDHCAAFNTVCRPLEQTAMARMMTPVRWTSDVGKNHDLADSSAPVTTTNHLTQQPHVKNQNSQTSTHDARRPTGTSIAKNVRSSNGVRSLV